MLRRFGETGIPVRTGSGSDWVLGVFFGKSATVEKWITDAAENEFYKTKAEDGGFVFLTTKSISAGSGGITLTESHESQPQGIAAKLMSILMRLFFKGVIKKAALQDLKDVKAAVEQEWSLHARFEAEEQDTIHNRVHTAKAG